MTDEQYFILIGFVMLAPALTAGLVRFDESDAWKFVTLATGVLWLFNALSLVAMRWF